MHMIKFIFDLDGTLTKEESIPKIASHFGIQADIKELTREAVRGNTPFGASFQQRVQLLKSLPVEEVACVAARIPLYEKMVDFISRHRDACIVATSNLRCWTEKLVKRIPCGIYASEAEMREGKVQGISVLLDKAAIVETYKRAGDTVVFIGDGSNDVDAMKRADIVIAAGITHRPADAVLRIADYTVRDEEMMVKTLEEIMKREASIR